MLPTDGALRKLSPFQSLWLYTHIKKEKKEEHKQLMDIVKLLCFMINPAGAKKVFASEADKRAQTENGTTTETVMIDESAFLAQVKKMDPNFDVDKYKAVMEGVE